MKEIDIHIFIRTMVNSHRSYRAAAHPITMVILLAIIILGVIAVYYIWNATVVRSGHAIKIQSVGFHLNQTRVYIQNIGKGTVNLDIIYIDNDKFTVQDVNCTVDQKGAITVGEGQTAAITINHQYTDKIHVKVVCTDGTSYETDWEPSEG